MPESREGVEFEQIRSGRSSLASAGDDGEEEGFALLSDSGASDDDLALEKDHVVGPSENGHASRRELSVDAQAKAHARAEHALTLTQAIRAYPMAIFWTLMVSFTVIMEGYDTILIGNFYAYPTFAAKYGQFVDAHGKHELSAAWQAVLGNSTAVGCFVGVLLNGVLVGRYGQKRVLLGALGALSCTVFVTFFAPNIAVLALGELLCGLPWGIFASSAPAYASEVLPLCLRVYLTSWTNMCFIIGQLIAAGVLATLVHRTDEWGFRIPFALQWAWPAVLIPVLSFAPESPWHLVRLGRLDAAERSLRRLVRRSAGVDVKAALAHIVHTDELERELTAGTRYRDCLRGTERRRTEIACVAFAGQILAGLPFAYNSTYFYEQIGLPTTQTYNLNTAGTAFGLVGALVNWVALMPRYGRRQIYLSGTFAMALLLFAVGVLAPWAEGSPVVALVQAFLTMAWTFTYQLSVGQLGWALPAEVGSTRLRQKTVCLARNAYYLASVTAGAAQPYLMNPGQLDLKGYAGFVWGAAAMLTFAWAYWRLPETRGRTYEELDWLFAKRTPTRLFETTVVDAFDKEEREELARSAAGEGEGEGLGMRLTSMVSRLPERGRRA